MGAIRKQAITRCVIDVPSGDAYATVFCSLHCDQLWISIMVSVSCPKKLP